MLLALLLALCSQELRGPVASAGPRGHGRAPAASYIGTNLEVRGVHSFGAVGKSVQVLSECEADRYLDR